MSQLFWPHPPNLDSVRKMFAAETLIGLVALYRLHMLANNPPVGAYFEGDAVWGVLCEILREHPLGDVVARLQSFPKEDRFYLMPEGASDTPKWEECIEEGTSAHMFPVDLLTLEVDVLVRLLPPDRAHRVAMFLGALLWLYSGAPEGAVTWNRMFCFASANYFIRSYLGGETWPFRIGERGMVSHSIREVGDSGIVREVTPFGNDWSFLLTARSLDPSIRMYSMRWGMTPDRCFPAADAMINCLAPYFLVPGPNGVDAV